MNKRSLMFFVYGCLLALPTFACGIVFKFEKNSVNWLFLIGLVATVSLTSMIVTDIVNRIDQDNQNKG